MIMAVVEATKTKTHGLEHRRSLNPDAATLLLGLEGASVTHFKADSAGQSTVYTVTSDDCAQACPSCGMLATRRKDYRTTTPRHLSRGSTAVRIRWRKARWYCTADVYTRGSFTEAIPAVPARMRTTTALRDAAGAAACDTGRTVVRARRDLGLSWPTTWRCFTDYAARLLPEDPPHTEAIGIDETRRGKPVWQQNPHTHTCELVADAWHIGFVDAIGGQGLFGQVEGRGRGPGGRRAPGPARRLARAGAPRSHRPVRPFPHRDQPSSAPRADGRRLLPPRPTRPAPPRRPTPAPDMEAVRAPGSQG
ncbi:hypothetical protein GCM10027590_31240 [Nocardiopsis nanhaiensis]